MNRDEYDAHPALNQSKLKLLIDNAPMYAKHKWDNPEKETTDALELGRLFHLWCLEPEKFFETYEVVEKPEYRGAGAKGRLEEWKAKCQKILDVGKTPIDPALFAQVKTMQEDVFSRRKVRAQVLEASHREKALVAEIDGVEMKCIPDFYFIRDGVAYVYDIKTDRGKVGPNYLDSLTRQHYDFQAYVYCRIIGKCHGVSDFLYFVWAIEKEEPYCSSVHELKQSSLEIGGAKFARALKKYKECIATDSWPDWPDYTGENAQEAPTWAVFKYGENNFFGEQ